MTTNNIDRDLVHRAKCLGYNCFPDVTAEEPTYYLHDPSENRIVMHEVPGPELDKWIAGQERTEAWLEKNRQERAERRDQHVVEDLERKLREIKTVTYLLTTADGIDGDLESAAGMLEAMAFEAKNLLSELWDFMTEKREKLKRAELVEQAADSLLYAIDRDSGPIPQEEASGFVVVETEVERARLVLQARMEGKPKPTIALRSSLEEQMKDMEGNIQRFRAKLDPALA